MGLVAGLPRRFFNTLIVFSGVSSLVFGFYLQRGSFLNFLPMKKVIDKVFTQKVGTEIIAWFMAGLFLAALSWVVVRAFIYLAAP